jgi:hypothetical protein
MIHFPSNATVALRGVIERVNEKDASCQFVFQREKIETRRKKWNAVVFSVRSLSHL